MRDVVEDLILHIGEFMAQDGNKCEGIYSV